MKKHRTFDCDLADTELQSQPKLKHQTLCTQSNPPCSSQTAATTTIATNAGDLNVCQNHDFDNANDHGNFHAQLHGDIQSSIVTRRTPNENVSNGQKLSKLVLSSSLHQLTDSKYHNNHKTNHPVSHTNAKYKHTTTSNIADNHSHFAMPHADQNNVTNSTPSTDQQMSSMINHIDHRSSSGNSNNNENTSTSRNVENNLQQSAQTRITDAEMNPSPTQTTVNHNKINNHKKREANLDTVHVVVGNESCDLDSAVSCLLMFHIISKMSDEINGKDKTRTLYIPLLNTTRDMLDSKCEVLWFLQKTLNIDKSFLTCKDDIDWNEIKKNGVEVLITLVDHNYNEEFKDIGKIVEIIDHHQVQNPQWLMENHSQIRLTLDTQVGSCTTLVAERLFYIYAEHHVSDEILLLIYGTVLLDTICLSEKAKRFTRRDVYLLKKLDSLLGSKKPVREDLYKQLVEVKNSPRDLNFEKLMKRDLKIYKDKHGMRIGIASLFGMAAREALGLAVNIDLDLFFRQNQYEAFIIMGLIADLEHSDSISRDLVLISSNKRLFEKLCEAFERDTSKLDLHPIGSDSSPDPEDNIINNKKIVDSSSDLSKATISADGATSGQELEDHKPFYKARIWLQRNVTSSRKVVAPLVLKVLHDGAQ